MKRSEINQAINKAKKSMAEVNFMLPDFSNWNIEQWKQNKDKLDTIKSVMLGWDVTDFGTDDFKKVGAVLFTIRNGNLYDENIGVPYCEKLIVFDDAEGQELPLHFHVHKTEDIINRGNGIMEIVLYQSNQDGTVNYEKDVEVYMDGIKKVFKAGQTYEVTPGNSITLTPGMYHRFGCKKGGGNLIVGEVSKINDDNKDNIFAEVELRFSVIEEDEVAQFVLCNEYDKIN